MAWYVGIMIGGYASVLLAPVSVSKLVAGLLLKFVLKLSQRPRGAVMLIAAAV